MKRIMFLLSILILAFGCLIATTPAGLSFGDPPDPKHWITHCDRGKGNGGINCSTKCMPLSAWNGHQNHVNQPGLPDDILGDTCDQPTDTSQPSLEVFTLTFTNTPFQPPTVTPICTATPPRILTDTATPTEIKLSNTPDDRSVSLPTFTLTPIPQNCDWCVIINLIRTIAAAQSTIAVNSTLAGRP